MSFTIVKMNQNSDNYIFQTTHGNNLQFLISAAFTFFLLDSSSADLRINENCCSDIVCTYRFTSPSGNGHVFWDVMSFLYQIRKCNLNRPIPKSMNFLSKKGPCKNIERLLRKMSVNISQKNVSFVAGHVNDVMRNAY